MKANSTNGSDNTAEINRSVECMHDFTCHAAPVRRLGSECRLMPTHSTCHEGPMQPLHHTAVSRRKGREHVNCRCLGTPCYPGTEGVQDQAFNTLPLLTAHRISCKIK